MKCGMGLKTRRKICDFKENCFGDENIETIECFSKRNCEADFGEEMIFWSEWSECSNKCGHGLRSRFYQCLDCETTKIYEQETCFNESACDNQSSTFLVHYFTILNRN